MARSVASVVLFLLAVWSRDVYAGEWEELGDHPCDEYHHAEKDFQIDFQVKRFTLSETLSFDDVYEHPYVEKICKWEVNVPADSKTTFRVLRNVCANYTIFVHDSNGNYIPYQGTSIIGSITFTRPFGIFYKTVDDADCTEHTLEASYSTDYREWVNIDFDPPAGSQQPQLPCEHGGVISELWPEICQCMPGFAGSRCEQACGPNHYGPKCEKQCSGGGEGCRGKFFFNSSNRKNSLCATGYDGPACNQVCRVGRYGASCTQECGHCSGEEGCDPYTGQCYGGCKPGYYGTQCFDEMTHLAWSGPNITSVSDTSLSGSVLLTASNVAGRGQVHFYELQFKEVSAGQWLKGVVGRVEDVPSSKPLHFTLTGLKPDAELDVRVLLLDQDLRGFLRVPHVRVRTLGPRRVAGLKVSNVTSGGMHVSWDTPTPTTTAQRQVFAVQYECLSLLGCTDSCPEAGGEVLVSEKSSVLLKGLQPAARYRVTVSAGDHWDSITTTTLPKAPAAAVSALRVQYVTNSSAVLQWGPAGDCPAVHGLEAGYRWQLSSSNRTGDTAAPLAVIDDLEPLASYQLSVAVLNTEGAAEQPWATLNFTTLPTVPDAPRDAAVYRLNRTSLWVRWRPPARPSGTLRYYTVQVAAAAGRQQRSENVEPHSACAAWPGFLCHGVHRLRPNTEYTLSLTATNEHGDQPGEQTSVRGVTTRGISLPPQHLIAKDRSARSVLLQWQLPDLLHSDLSYFEVQVTRKLDADSEVAEDPEPVRVHVTQEQPVYEYTLQDLQPAATYTVAVGCGWHGAPARLEVTTTEDVETTTTTTTTTIAPPVFNPSLKPLW